MQSLSAGRRLAALGRVQTARARLLRKHTLPKLGPTAFSYAIGGECRGCKGVAVQTWRHQIHIHARAKLCVGYLCATAASASTHSCDSTKQQLIDTPQCSQHHPHHRILFARPFSLRHIIIMLIALCTALLPAPSSQHDHHPLTSATPDLLTQFCSRDKQQPYRHDYRKTAIMAFAGGAVAAPASAGLCLWMDAAWPSMAFASSTGKFALDQIIGCAIWQAAYSAAYNTQ